MKAFDQSQMMKDPWRDDSQEPVKLTGGYILDLTTGRLGLIREEPLPGITAPAWYYLDLIQGGVNVGSLGREPEGRITSVEQALTIFLEVVEAKSLTDYLILRPRKFEAVLSFSNRDYLKVWSLYGEAAGQAAYALMVYREKGWGIEGWPQAKWSGQVGNNDVPGDPMQAIHAGIMGAQAYHNRARRGESND